MEFELSLDPDDAGRLPRLPSLAPLKTANMRSRAVRIVWHDTPDGTLAEQALALGEQRGAWRLERLYPGDDPWPPAAPAPVLGQGSNLAAAMQTPPEPLLPIAAFEGRAQTLSLSTEGTPISLTLLNGVVRTLAVEHRVSRVMFDGAEPEVLNLAQTLANEFRLSVPRASLAAEALALTRGAEPPARRLGAPELPADMSVASAFAYVVGHLTDVILHFAPAAAAGQDGPEPVHQMRVAVRRARSAIKVFHSAVRCPAVEAADASLKMLAHKLGPTRDWDVFVGETAVSVTKAFPDDKKLHRLLNAAERRRRMCHAELRSYLEGPQFRRLGIELAWLVSAQSWHATIDEPEQTQLATPLTEFAIHVLNKRLKRLAKADGDIATLESGVLHGIRLRAKRLRYAAEIFATLYPGKPANRFLRRLSRLQDRLGSLNDGAVAATLLAELAGNGGNQGFATGLVLGFVGARGVRARKRIDQAWQKFLHTQQFWS